VSPESDFVERMAGALIDAGLPRVPALVFSALLVDEDGRMTAVELAESLHVSSGSVSAAVNYLARVQMLRRERDLGSRRHVYVVEDETWHATLTRRDQVYAPMIDALTAGLAALDPGTPAHRRILVTREFFDFVNTELAALADKWERRRAELVDPADRPED
jgi:DNA-binding transcriptional regulator GbsR (MarR family)